MAKDGYIGVRIGEELSARFKRACKIRQTTMSVVVRQAALDYCEEIEAKYGLELTKKKE